MLGPLAKNSKMLENLTIVLFFFQTFTMANYQFKFHTRFVPILAISPILPSCLALYLSMCQCDARLSFLRYKPTNHPYKSSLILPFQVDPPISPTYHSVNNVFIKNLQKRNFVYQFLHISMTFPQLVPVLQKNGSMAVSGLT